MTEEKKALEQILTAKKRSGLCIENIINCRPLSRELVRDQISQFVLIRYFLDDEDVRGLSFDEIAERSVAKSANVSKEMVKELDTSVDCMGASSLTSKKAMLFRQIEKLLDITFPAMKTAWVEKLNDIGDLVYDELCKKQSPDNAE